MLLKNAANIAQDTYIGASIPLVGKLFEFFGRSPSSGFDDGHHCSCGRMDWAFLGRLKSEFKTSGLSSYLLFLMKHSFHLSFLHFRGSDAEWDGSAVAKYDEPNNVYG